LIYYRDANSGLRSGKVSEAFLVESDS